MSTRVPFTQYMFSSSFNDIMCNVKTYVTIGI